MILRNILLYLASKKNLANKIMRLKIFKNMANRFIAGETREDAIRITKKLNAENIAVTFDHLGENTFTKEQSESAAEEYIILLEEINKNNINANISIKLTQMGLDIDSKICYQNVEKILKKAAELNNFIRIDMESSNYTDLTLEVFKNLRKRYENVGIVIQAYLYRSAKDIDEILQLRGSIRLCKGAYNEPSTIAFKRKKDTDKNYLLLMKKLLFDSQYHAIATHDEKIIRAAIEYVREFNLPKEKFEFQMLYGIRTNRQLELTKEGYRMRIYLPYGTEWYPYFMRRLGERPANLFFFIKHLL